MRADKLYRYINFFDLYNLLEHKLLRVPQATSLDDKNEAFGFVLRELDGKYVAALGAPTGFDGERIIKTLSYISCWTAEPDKIAMWLLYSKDSEGFRIRTTRAKLNSVLMAYRNSYATLPDRIQNVSPKEDVNIFDVAYEDFRKIKKELEMRNEDIERTMDSLPDTESKADRIRAFSKTARETMRTLRFTDNPWSYKDKAYEHEHEVRAVIEFEASDEEGDSLVSGRVDWTYFADRFPSCIHMAICDDFVEDICIDERCTQFKKDVYRSFLSKYGYSLGESQVFSSLFDEPGVP